MNDKHKAILKVSINGKEYEAKKNETILELAKRNDIYIPTLCYHPDLCLSGVCRLCVVEVGGCRSLQASCSTPVLNGMNIQTESEIVNKSRKMVLELILANHYTGNSKCEKGLSCELQELFIKYGVGKSRFGRPKEKRYKTLDNTVVIRDNDKCIKCRRCVDACEYMQCVEAIKPMYRSNELSIGSVFDVDLDKTGCVLCGQCINYCPTTALVEKEYIKEVYEALNDSTKHVVVQTAPSMRATLAEEFNIPAGRSSTKKMTTALRKMGFDAVFDTNFSADLTIIEESAELLDRMKKKFLNKEETSLPLFTSCSPGWINYIEYFYPELLSNVSTCKSPQQMFGAIAKTYYASKINIHPEDIVCVAVMPCTAKKFEADRPEMRDSGYKDVDYVLTVREFAKMIRQSDINLFELPDSDYDAPMGISTGAGLIFGVTGGVMEAAMRTAYEVITQREVPYKNLNICPVRGMEGVREAFLQIEDPIDEWKFLDGFELKVAVAHELRNAKKLLDSIKANESDYHFVEVMACPGGCLGGGGQPKPTNMEIRKKRARVIYDEDRALPYRKSHENPAIIELYRDFIGEPLGEKAHKLLHTYYTARVD